MAYQKINPEDRKVKPHLCSGCGCTDPDSFYKGHKSKCKICQKKLNTYVKIHVPKPFLCQDCSTTDPDRFRGGHRSRCERCNSAITCARVRLKRIEANKNKPPRVPMRNCKRCDIRKTISDNFTPSGLVCKSCHSIANAEKDRIREEKKLIKEQEKLNRVPKPVKKHLCGTCGEVDSDSFYKGHKINCRRCYNASKRVSKDKIKGVRDHNLIHKRWDAAKKRATDKGMVFDITKDALFDLYDRQGGICTYSGLKMDTVNAGHQSVSLDRIDSDLGYTLDNCQLICSIINRWKYTLTEEELIYFLQHTSKHIL